MDPTVLKAETKWTKGQSVDVSSLQINHLENRRIQAPFPALVARTWQPVSTKHHMVEQVAFISHDQWAWWTCEWQLTSCPVATSMAVYTVPEALCMWEGEQKAHPSNPTLGDVRSSRMTRLKGQGLEKKKKPQAVWKPSVKPTKV